MTEKFQGKKTASFRSEVVIARKSSHSFVGAADMDVEMGAGGLIPPWILKLLEKRLFFQFRVVKNKFHQFWPPP